MNTQEINDILEMREQLAALKKRLNTQEMVNDRLIKETISRKLSKINGQAVALCTICLVMIPLEFLNFQRMGHSFAFCIATSALFLICFVAMLVSHYRLRKRDIYSGDLVTVYKEVSRLRKIYKSWHYWSVPMLVVWFAWFEYEIYRNFADVDMKMMLIISGSGILGLIIGGIIGLRIHKRTLRNADDLLQQIEEIKREE